MSMSVQRLGSLLAVLLSFVAPAWGELSAEQVKMGKAATALVELREDGRKGFGTAFCIDSGGTFVTNAHVAGNAKTLKLVLNSSEPNESTAEATVLRVDRQLDLAILQIKSNQKSLTALTLGSAGDLIDTMPVVAFGFPFGSALALDKGDYPSVSVNVGRITSLRKKKGALELIQLDAALNPGNSGGPVLDDKGSVIGIVQAGVQGSGINFAIPVTRLAGMLEKPEIVVSPTTMPFAARSDELPLTVRVVSLTKPKQPFNVTVSLSTAAGDNRSFTATAGQDGEYSTRVVPVPAVKGPQQLIVSAKFTNGSITARVAAQEVQVGARSISLSEISSFEMSPKGVANVTLADGKTLSGSLGGVNALAGDLGGYTVTLDLTRAQSVRLEQSDSPVNRIAYKVSVSSGDKLIGESSGSIELVGGSPEKTTPSSIEVQEPALEADIVRRKLPAPIDDVIVAGSGRYLLLHVRKVRKLAVFDVTQAKVVQFLPLTSDDVLIAGSDQKIVIVVRDQKVMQRWDLAKLERELTNPLPEGQIDCLAMGYAGNGPLLMMTREGPKLYDLATLRPSSLKIDRNQGSWVPHPDMGLQVRASADGSTFAAWQPGSSPMGIRTMVVEGSTARCRYEHTTAGILLPSFDGSQLFTGQGIYSTDLKPLSPEQFRGVICIPSYNSAYFLGLRTGETFGRSRGAQKNSTLSIYTTGDRRLLLTLNDLELPEAGDQVWGRREGLSADERIHFFPDANLLITISDDRDELILHQFRITDALEKAGIDYFFVTSIPPKSVRRGKTYTYQIVTRSKRGDVKYKLEGGPEGMKISPTGRLDWNVPSQQPPGPINVIVSINDASGQEVYHSFSLTVE